MQNSGPTRSSTRAESQGRSLLRAPGVHADLTAPAALPSRSRSEPRRLSRSASLSLRASRMHSPPRQSTTTTARSRQPWRSSAATASRRWSPPPSAGSAIPCSAERVRRPRGGWNLLTPQAAAPDSRVGCRRSPASRGNNRIGGPRSRRGWETLARALGHESGSIRRRAGRRRVHRAPVHRSPQPPGRARWLLPGRVPAF